MKPASFFSLVFFLISGLCIAFALGYFLFLQKPLIAGTPHWAVRSIDTMKYSRDLAREKVEDPSFVAVIDQQMAAIAATGATHVAIATPYDKEFLPMLKLWVTSARAHGLHVWFRGNFSGWEQWFGYERITPQQHTDMTKAFIQDNPDLFVDGDIFTSCPECENGDKLQYGDPVQLAQHRNFLLNEYQITKASFIAIHKDVKANYYSMNYDVAMAMMDPETTRQFDGTVVIDHYVREPDKLAVDIKKLADKTGGKVVLGEFGAPIPDINGHMSDGQQKAWLQQALTNLADVPQLEGMNYWVNTGGTSQLWFQDGTPRPAVSILSAFFGGK